MLQGRRDILGTGQIVLTGWVQASQTGIDLYDVLLEEEIESHVHACAKFIKTCHRHETDQILWRG